MSAVTCGTCDARIPVSPVMPLDIFTENGRQVARTNYRPVYEHMRDEHPEVWTDALAAEFAREYPDEG